MPFPEDDENAPRHEPDDDSRLEQARTEYFSRLAAKALHHTEDVEAVSGVPKYGELWVWANTNVPNATVSRVLALFGAETQYITFRDTEEFGLVASFEVVIDPSEVSQLHEHHRDYPDGYTFEDLIEDEFIDYEIETGEDGTPLHYERLGDGTVDWLETEQVKHRSSGCFTDYAPRPEGRLESTVRAHRLEDGRWGATYETRYAVAATRYSAIRKVIDRYHRDNFGSNAELPSLENDAEEQPENDTQETDSASEPNTDNDGDGVDPFDEGNVGNTADTPPVPEGPPGDDEPELDPERELPTTDGDE